MKKRVICFIAVFFLSIAAVFASGEKEDNDKMILRLADQVPNLITPYIWDGQTFSLNSSIYDYLVEMDAKTGNLVPALATSWNTDKGKVWTFKIRKGVKFHDGSDFTSKDVKYTLELTQNPDLGHLKAQDFAVMDKVETPDDYTVVITLKEALPTFVYQLTDYHMAMLSSDYNYEKLGESAPMGTGPFMLKSLVPKESALLVKNPDYWQKGLPKADELRIYFISDIDARVSMLESGEVDIVPQISPIVKQKLEAEEGFKVISPYQEHRYIAMAMEREPFDDNNVRLAFKYSMDPEMLARACQGTLGKTIFYNETPILNKASQYKDIPFRGRDIKKAKELLAKAGYPDGLTVELYYASDHPYGNAIAQTLKELVAPSGINLQLKGFPRDIYLSQYWMKEPLLLTGWGVRTDPSMVLSLAFQSTGPWNESHMSDPEIDMLINKIKTEVDKQKRQQYYDKLQDIFTERGTVINLQVPYLVGMSNRVMDYRQPLTMLTQLKYAYLQ